MPFQDEPTPLSAISVPSQNRRRSVEEDFVSFAALVFWRNYSWEISEVSDHVSRREIAIGARAAANAGNNPPMNPMTNAMPMAKPSRSGVTRKAKAT